MKDAPSETEHPFGLRAFQLHTVSGDTKVGEPALQNRGMYAAKRRFFRGGSKSASRLGETHVFKKKVRLA